ncbi:MAG: pyruvate oxidase [Chloroflexi bacterium]|nr:MAG: pyruvate oxidase [Chloroflexota bacterium]
MEKTVADALVDALVNWGVEFIFGKRGSGLVSILDSLNQRRNQIQLIEVKNEEAASLMACGYARFTGKVGVCFGSAGSGGIRLLDGLYDAKLDGQPVLALTGAPPFDTGGMFGQQDVPLELLFMDVAAFSTRVTSPDQVENSTNQAFRAALGQHGVAHITIPVDIQAKPVKRGNTSVMAAQSISGLFAQRARLPYEGDLRQAAEILNTGKRVVIIAGKGALGASAELDIVAGILAAPIIKALQGKAVLPDDNPYTTGVLGPLGTEPSKQAINNCDTLLMVGTSFPYTEYLPVQGTVRAVQIDNDPTRIGLRYLIEVGLVGDSQRTLKELLPKLEHKMDRSWLEEIQGEMGKWRAEVETEGSSKSGRLAPQMVAWELGKILPEDAVLACDSGNVTGWWAKYIDTKEGQMHAVSGNLSVPGSSLPYAIAAQAAFPNRVCAAFTGDSEISVLLTEFATCVRYGLPVKIVILNHGVSKESLLRPDLQGDEAYIESTAETTYTIRTDFAAFARSYGAAGFTVKDPSELCPALEAAFANQTPAIIDCHVL